MKIRRFIPDFISQTGNTRVTLNLRNFPNDTAASSSLGPFDISSSTQKVDTRARARAIALKVENTGSSQSWKLGTFRLDMQTRWKTIMISKFVKRNVNPYQDKIMGGLEGDPDPYNFNQLFEQSYIEPVGVPGMDQRAINFKDAPVPFGLRQNNPFVGPIDNFILSRGNPDNNIINRTKSAVSSGIGKGF